MFFPDPQRSWLRRLAVALLVLAPACGPSHRLERKTTAVHWYRARSRCGQGPYEIEVPATGRRWGEAVQVEVQAPRRVRFTAAIAEGDRPITRRTVTVGGRGDRPDNARCVASLDEVGGGAAPGSDPVEGGGPGAAENEGGGAGGGPAPSPSGGAARSPELVSETGEPPGSGAVLVEASWSNPTLEPPALHAGEQLRIKLWSAVPNDLEGVVFIVRQLTFVPDSGDAAFEAHLRAAREKRERKRRRRAEKARRRARRAEPPRSRRPAPSTAADERAARRRARARRERERKRKRKLEREAYCQEHLEDRSCWGPGGFQIHQELERRAGERDRYCGQHAEDARCWSQKDWSEHRAKWSARLQRAEPPKEAPPPPRAETRPPAPSEHAEWRPGYWHWSDGWRWIAGQWRVPQSDVDQGLTARAPEAPPAPKSEPRPPRPAPDAVWVAGYWHWSGEAFVWVSGSWQLPPSAGLRWRPTTWTVEVDGAVLVPGAWVTVHP